MASHSSQHLEDIPHCCPMIKGLLVDVWLDWVPKGLPSLHLILLHAEGHMSPR